METRPQTQPPSPPRVIELEPDECWSLASALPVGRLAWTGPHGPTVIPVNFAVTGAEVLVRTTAYSEMARECDDSPVAFEVDEVDASARSGWSVLMRGRGHLESVPSGEAGPDVWPPGPRSLRLRIEVTEVTGRRLTSSG
jgi:nitroimidazol reductase NimA-like FMN-containing flavoprotein (pyridoxamine 5'-phosphate oxidase superfamily)